jgi:hypothetical protein
MRVRQIRSEISPRLRQIDKQLQPIVKMAGRFFQDVTPRRTGNARRNTIVNNQSIEANYAYANRLNEGHSKQAPKGMTDPTINYLRRTVKKILR